MYSRSIVGKFLLVGIISLLGIPNAFAYEGGAVPNGAAITGKITFRGTPPPPKLHELVKFPQAEFCGQVDNDGKGHRIQYVVRVNDGTLSDVVVFIEGIERGKPFKFNGTDIKADLCRFLVQGPSSFVGVVQVKHEFRVENLDADPSDPKSATGVLHNPHTYNVYKSSSRTIFNKPLTMKGQVIKYKIKKRDLKKSPTMFLQCDQHNFMEAWFHGVDNPYYAVVGADGTFTIDGIPPGTYQIKAWHPLMQNIKEQKITLSPDEKTEVNFEFAESELRGG